MSAKINIVYYTGVAFFLVIARFLLRDEHPETSLTSTACDSSAELFNHTEILGISRLARILQQKKTEQDESVNSHFAKEDVFHLWHYCLFWQSRLSDRRCTDCWCLVPKLSTLIPRNGVRLRRFEDRQHVQLPSI